MDFDKLNEGTSIKPKILIVEDDPVSALLLRKVLESRHFKVDHAENGVQALELFDKGEYRIVISDWMMPEMDGVSLCREMRKRANHYTYVILLSAKGQRADRLQAFEAGIDDFLTKPLDREDLFARLKVAMRILDAEESLHKQKEELVRAGERLKLANINLQIASRRFEELFSGMPVACFTFDKEGMIHEWNREAEKLFGIKPEDALLQFVWDMFDASFWAEELVQQLFDGSFFANHDWNFNDSEGQEHNLVCNVFPLRGPTGEILGAISANLDITERRTAEKQIEEQMVQINQFALNLEMQKTALEEANEKLSTLAITDGLTGLWNHRRFQEELESAYSHHSRNDRALSLLFLDVDNFKAYNDAYGHPAGDVVLKTVASVLLEVSRTHEAVARYGGEEFAIILPETDENGAILAAERFREAIANTDWPMRKVTASFGVATLHPGHEGPKELIQHADAALYVSKQNGRNRVTHFGAVGDQLSEHLGTRKIA